MKYFTEKELGIENASAIIKKNMEQLVNNILDPLREEVGKIRINSGYRTLAHNRKIGGSPTSDHIKGCAADIFPLETDIDDVFTLIIRKFKYNQVILERNNAGARWIHVSYKKDGNKQQAMTASVTNGKAIYKNA